MHRVELKANTVEELTPLSLVPNAPCGVESPSKVPLEVVVLPVPNAPCGVERCGALVSYRTGVSFLMHRVELKEP